MALLAGCPPWSSERAVTPCALGILALEVVHRHKAALQLAACLAGDMPRGRGLLLTLQTLLPCPASLVACFGSRLQSYSYSGSCT